jgi:hypothetical protein
MFFGTTGLGARPTRHFDGSMLCEDLTGRSVKGRMFSTHISNRVAEMCCMGISVCWILVFL